MRLGENFLAGKVTKVIINEEPIELYKILKIENLAESGAEAKHLVAEGLVRVNGELETRKRKKIFDGDTIAFETFKLQVKLIK